MPTVSGSGNEEVESQDEVKVFKYEGEEEESEKSSSENLKEDKSSLITETEEEKSPHVPSSSAYASASSKSDGRLPDTPPFGLFGASAWGPDRLGYLSPFYAYTNGSSAMAAKEMGLGAGAAGSSIFSLYHNGQHLGQPPPAHMGISPYQLDTKTGLRPPVYPFATSGQYAYPLAADFTAQMAASAWFSPGGLMPPHPGLTPPLGHPLVPSPKTELPNTSHDNHSMNQWIAARGRALQKFSHHNLSDQKNSLSSANDKSQMIETKNGDKKPHIKKPLNAFMLYMKEMRAKVVAECTLKESAAINQILGRKWHALTRDEQAKYYEMARKERQLHMQMYPGWSSRQNYSQGKKKKRNRDKNQDGANMKKCRARYGLEQQSQWCKPCRRKKKCIRYMEGEEETGPGSTGSHDMSQESDSEDDSFNVSLQNSSPMERCSPASSSNLLSPGPSLSSPSGSASLLMASPASPLTPGDRDLFHVPSIPPLAPVVRPPVGNNPRDVNNPLSVNQLTGQTQESSRPTMVSVT